jgi:hypothetical protein
MRIILLLFLAACSESGSHGTEAVGSCDRSSAGDLGVFSYLAGTCQEYSGSKDNVKGYSTNCGMGGVWSDHGCPHDGAVGGCEAYAFGVYGTTWYYASQFPDAEAIKAYCTGTWVSP